MGIGVHLHPSDQLTVCHWALVTQLVWIVKQCSLALIAASKLQVLGVRLEVHHAFVVRHFVVDLAQVVDGFSFDLVVLGLQAQRLVFSTDVMRLPICS